MTAKEALDKVRGLLKQHFGIAEEAKDAKVFEQVTLPDGSAVQYDVLEPGGELLVVAEDESTTPAPAGEYVLEDGSIIVVTEPGIIAEVKAPEVIEEAMAEDTPGSDPKGSVDWSTEIKWIKEAIANTAKQIATLEAAMQMFKSNTGQAFASMQELMDIISKESPEKPATKPKQTTFGTHVPDREAARQRMIDAAAALHKKKSA